MSTLLHQLARDGDISWLSYYFAEFVSQRDHSPMDALPVLSAALVSEASLAGDVCVDLEYYQQRSLFRGSRVETGQIPGGRDLQEWRNTLLNSSSVGTVDQPSLLIIDETRLYLNRFWHYEAGVADIITTMLARDANVSDTLSQHDAAEPLSSHSDIDADQLRAMHSAASRHFSVISGGPGSGKTSTVVRMLALLLARAPGCRIALAAPTGKAAARMMDSIRERLESLGVDPTIKSAIPREASTLHRLLGYGHQSYAYHAGRRLPVDCVVIDEASMIDLKLMHHLLVALPDHAKLILLGDRDQLASVAAGNVLGDITGHGHSIDNSDLPIASATSLLRSSYRFGSDSAIGELSRLVRLGDAEQAVNLLRRNASGLHWIETDPIAAGGDSVDESAMRWIRDAYRPIFDCATPGEAFEVYLRSRLLCVTNRGPLGTDTLNQRISTALLADTDQADTDYFAGLPIMITRNLHDLELFNGDTGILWVINGELRACFPGEDGSVRDLAINRLTDIKPAWAITVHKAQGSEFESVLLLMPTEVQPELLSRELLYTGITRARSGFLLQASEAVLTQAVTRLTRRFSGLAGKLGWPISDIASTR